MGSQFKRPLLLASVAMCAAFGLTQSAMADGWGDRHHDGGGRQQDGGGRQQDGGGREGGRDRSNPRGAPQMNAIHQREPAPQARQQSAPRNSNNVADANRGQGSDWQGRHDNGGNGGDGHDRGERHDGDRHAYRQEYREDRHEYRENRRGSYYNRREFDGYTGLRIGFYFAPHYGYYQVPREYYGHRYGRGEYLPRFFYNYRVADYDYYDLPYPEPGTAYYFCGNDIVLIDTYTGEILEVYYDIY